MRSWERYELAQQHFNERPPLEFEYIALCIPRPSMALHGTLAVVIAFSLTSLSTIVVGLRCVLQCFNVGVLAHSQQILLPICSCAKAQLFGLDDACCFAKHLGLSSRQLLPSTLHGLFKSQCMSHLAKAIVTSTHMITEQRNLCCRCCRLPSIMVDIPPLLHYRPLSHQNLNPPILQLRRLCP